MCEYRFADPDPVFKLNKLESEKKYPIFDSLRTNQMP